MPRLIMIALMLGSLAFMPACGGDGSEEGGADTETSGQDAAGGDTSPTNPREQAVEAMLEKMNQFPEILSGVTDNASAEAASGKLTELAASIKPLVEQWNSLGELTSDEASSIRSKYTEQMMASEEKIREQITRIAGENPLLMTQLQGGINAIDDALSDFDIDGDE